MLYLDLNGDGVVGRCPGHGDHQFFQRRRSLAVLSTAATDSRGGCTSDARLVDDLDRTTETQVGRHRDI